MTGLTPTAIIALLQAMVIFFGFAAVRIALKMSGYPDYTGYGVNPVSVLLRNYGLWLLLLPVCWMVVTLWADRNHRGPALYRGLMGGGLLAIFAALLFYAWAAMCCVPGPHPL